jgi:hypothetical protein
MLGDFCETFSKLFCTTDIAKLALSSEDNFLRFFDQLHLPLYRPPHKDLTLKLFKKDIRSDIIDALHDDIISRYGKYLHISVDPLIVADRIRRTGSAGTAPTFQMFLDVRSIASERNLFLDQDIYSLLEILPSKIRNQAGFAAKIIYEFSPKTSSIPNSNTLIPLHWPKLLHETTKDLKPHVGSLKRKLISNTHKTSGSWPKKDILYSNDPDWNTYISNLIENDGLFDSQIFNYDIIKQFWHEYNNGRIELSTDIERLVAIATLAKIANPN